jgi:hypothetical protein
VSTRGYLTVGGREGAGETNAFDTAERLSGEGHSSAASASCRCEEGPREDLGHQSQPSGCRLGEQLLRAWTENWQELATIVGVTWDVGPPYEPGDFENAPCIWQERR